MASFKLERTITHLLKQKAAAQVNDSAKPHSNLFDEAQAYGQIIGNFRDAMRNEVYILDQQKKIPVNEFSIFSCNIWQNIRVNVNLQSSQPGQGTSLSDYEINMIKYLDTLSSTIQDVVVKYCDIVLNENFDSQKFNLEMTKLLFNKLFVPIYFEWKKNQFNNNVIQKIEELHKILKPTEAKIYFQRAFIENHHNIMCNIDKSIKNESEQKSLYEKLIEFLRGVQNDTKEKNNSDQVAVINKIVNSSSNTNISDSATKIDNSITKINNKNNNTKKVVIINKNIINEIKQDTSKIKEKDLPRLKEKDLDNLKVQGLKDECKKRNLNTSKCSKRADYIKLLLSYDN